MGRKALNKDTKVTTVNPVDDTPVVPEQTEENVVNLEKVDEAEAKNDVSEVITSENISENVEKVDTPDNVEPLEKQEAPAEMLNESATDGDAENENVYDVDGPGIAKVIDPETEDMNGITPTYVACPPVKDTYAPAEATPTYTAQCPPKPANEKPGAYFAQKPF